MAFLYGTALATFVLKPRGEEFLCPNTRLSKTLICNVTGTVVRWDVSVGSMSPTVIFFATSIPGVVNAPENISGIVISLLSVSSQGLSSQLVIPDRLDLLPISVECSPGIEIINYSITYRGKKYMFQLLLFIAFIY